MNKLEFNENHIEILKTLCEQTKIQVTISKSFADNIIVKIDNSNIEYSWLEFCLYILLEKLVEKGIKKFGVGHKNYHLAMMLQTNFHPIEYLKHEFLNSKKKKKEML